MAEDENNENNKKCFYGCLGITFILMVVILVPISFAYLDYYEYGLRQRKTTGAVDTAKVYDVGRYFIGPDHTFVRYQ